MSAPPIPLGRPAAASLLERAAWRVALAAASRIAVGHLTVVLPDGRRRGFGDPAAADGDRAEIRLHDREALVRMLLHGETGGGEA